MEDTIDLKLQNLYLLSQEKLQATICSIPSSKDLIIEPSLFKPMEHVCAASWLKLKGIQHIFKFDPYTIIPRNTNIQIYLVRSNLGTYLKLLKQFHEQEQKNPSDRNSGVPNFHVIFVPNCYMYFSSLLEEEGLHGIVKLHRFNWDFMYIDRGVISMELPEVGITRESDIQEKEDSIVTNTTKLFIPLYYLRYISSSPLTIVNVFERVFVGHDTALLTSIAQSFRILQMIFGKPEFILTYGQYSKKIINMIEIMGPWPIDEKKCNAPPDITGMIIVDRDKDYPSCLLSPAIYSGLLLEVFKYNAGEIELERYKNKILNQKLKIFHVPKDIPTKSEATSSSCKEQILKNPVVRLNSIVDEIYGDNRYKNFSQASSLVKAQAKTIGVELENVNKMRLEEMQDYVSKKLPKITELKSKVTKHLNASEIIINMLGRNYQKIQSLEEDILNNTSRKKILSEIDEILTTDGQKYNTLRLMCLAHISMDLTCDELSFFIQNYCNYFGYGLVYFFHQLSKAGLLPSLEDKTAKTKILPKLPIPKFQQTEFQANANRLKLLISSTEAEGMTTQKSDSKILCPSYVFNGLYIPLVAQLSSIILRSNNIDDFTQRLGNIEGINFHLKNLIGNSNSSTIKQIAASIKMGTTKEIFPLQKRNILVFVIGGVTFAEIAACEVIGKLTDSQIVVASNNIISGDDLISSATS